MVRPQIGVRVDRARGAVLVIGTVRCVVLPVKLGHDGDGQQVADDRERGGDSAGHAGRMLGKRARDENTGHDCSGSSRASTHVMLSTPPFWLARVMSASQARSRSDSDITTSARPGSSIIPDRPSEHMR